MQHSLNTGPQKEITRPNLRTIALPAEHGGWGFLLEPLLLGFLLAPTAAAVTLAVAVVAAFLLRQPVKIMALEWRRGYRSSRAAAARRFVALYGGIAVISGAATFWLAGASWLIPILLALPFGAIFLYYDMTQPGRTWQAELSAPLVLTSVVASMLLLDGWPLLPSLALWIALVARALPSVLFVRTRLRLDRGKSPNVLTPILAHTVGLLLIVVLIWQDLLPLVAGVPFILLLLRAIHGVSPLRFKMSIKALGFVELAIGILMVLFVATGY